MLHAFCICKWTRGWNRAPRARTGCRSRDPSSCSGDKATVEKCNCLLIQCWPSGRRKPLLGEMAFYTRYREERSTENYKYRAVRTWDWRDKNDQRLSCQIQLGTCCGPCHQYQTAGGGDKSVPVQTVHASDHAAEDNQEYPEPQGLGILCFRRHSQRAKD